MEYEFRTFFRNISETIQSISEEKSIQFFSELIPKYRKYSISKFRNNSELILKFFETINEMFLQIIIWTSLIFVLLLILLRITLPHVAFLFYPDEIPYKSTTESTQWLNFVLTRVVSHFQSPQTLLEISHLIQEKVSFLKEAQLSISTIGTSPIIKSVQTLNTKDPGDIKLLIPLTWSRGPSIDVTFSNGISIGLDLINFNGKFLIEWPPDNYNIVYIRSVGQIKVSFDIIISFKQFIQFNLQNIPLIGAIINYLAPAFLAKYEYKLDLNKIKDKINPHESTLK